MDIRLDSSFFINTEVVQIKYGLYRFQLVFDKMNMYISSTAIAEYYQSDGTLNKWDSDNGRATFSVNRLLEIRVKSTFVEPCGTLHLHFENGDKIKFLAIEGAIESFMIRHDEDWEVIYYTE